MVSAMVASVRAARSHAYENPRPEVTALVPDGARRILDLGCSSGALGAVLRARGAEVVGVERDPEYAHDAADRLDRVVVADAEELAARDDLEAELGRFDCLVAADVLDHLVDPWQALAAYSALLDCGAAAVVSLPNVRHWETFWQLGRHGRWPVRSEGIFDRTHLRWFTLADAWELLDRAGLDVVAVHRVLRARPTVPGERLQALAAVPGLRTLLTFQHVISARRR
jgi:2-polyprenyl-3-methyl-5-hydroxy-6-metoxy-1,4-benzoquinol methylase